MPTNSSSIRTQINFSMLGGVLAIISGLAAPSDATTFRLYLVTGVFSAGVIAGMISSFWCYPRAPWASGFDELRIVKTVFLIWIPFPIVAAIDACAVAASVYNPISHDGYSGMMPSWWLVVVAYILIGLSCTTAYFSHIKTCEQLHSGRSYVYISWSAQLAVRIAWAVTPIVAR